MKFSPGSATFGHPAVANIKYIKMRHIKKAKFQDFGPRENVYPGPRGGSQPRRKDSSPDCYTETKQIAHFSLGSAKCGETSVGKMRLSASCAIKVRINIKHRIRDRVTFKISVRAKVWAGEH